MRWLRETHDIALALPSESRTTGLRKRRESTRKEMLALLSGATAGDTTKRVAQADRTCQRTTRRRHHPRPHRACTGTPDATAGPGQCRAHAPPWPARDEGDLTMIRRRQTSTCATAGGYLDEAEVVDAGMLRTPTGQAGGPPNGRFPDNNDAMGAAVSLIGTWRGFLIAMWRWVGAEGCGRQWGGRPRRLRRGR